MSTSEFRYSKKRKHYAYLFKSKGEIRLSILLSTKKITKNKKFGKEILTLNIPLLKHPNPLSDKNAFLIDKVYFDKIETFDEKVLKTWNFEKNDKRKVKRIKRKAK